MSESIDVHTHVVPENFPPYRGSSRDIPWPSMAEAHACHRHVMISGKVYRTVSDGSWSVPRRVEDMNGCASRARRFRRCRSSFPTGCRSRMRRF
jgi:hypothetical protein